eukprot:g43222.t1
MNSNKNKNNHTDPPQLFTVPRKRLSIVVHVVLWKRGDFSCFMLFCRKADVVHHAPSFSVEKRKRGGFPSWFMLFCRKEEKRGGCPSSFMLFRRKKRGGCPSCFMLFCRKEEVVHHASYCSVGFPSWNTLQAEMQ